jgi:hypothetical protein
LSRIELLNALLNHKLAGRGEILNEIDASVTLVIMPTISTVIQRISRQMSDLFNNECVASLSQAIIVLPTSAHRRYQRDYI